MRKKNEFSVLLAPFSPAQHPFRYLCGDKPHISSNTPKEKQFFLVINEDDDDAQDDNDGRDAPPGTRRRGERWVLEEEANSFGGGRVRAGDRRGRRRW